MTSRSWTACFCAVVCLFALHLPAGVWTAEASPVFKWPGFQPNLRTGPSNSPVKARPIEISLTPAADGTPSQRAVFGGTWNGWMCRNRTFDVKLAVAEVDIEGARIEYSVGSERSGTFAATITARFDGDVLRGPFPRGAAELIVGMRPDGHMNIKYSRLKGDGWCTGIMQRVKSLPGS